MSVLWKMDEHFCSPYSSRRKSFFFFLGYIGKGRDDLFAISIKIVIVNRSQTKIYTSTACYTVNDDQTEGLGKVRNQHISFNFFQAWHL